MSASQQQRAPVARRKKKTPIYVWILRFVFIIGLAIFLYPLISNWRYSFNASRAVETFDQARQAIDPKEIDRRIGLAAAYNEALQDGSTAMADPYIQARRREGLAEYARMLEVHEQIGHISIPKLMINIPIFAGTSETVLQMGAGHLEGSSLPIGGNNTHTVITAHRGLPEAKLFTELDQLQIGDRFYVTNIKETLAYQVDQIVTIEPSDFAELSIVPGHDYATLLTCTPYMINTHRLLVRGHRVPYVQAIAEKELKDHQVNHTYRTLFFVTLALLLVLTFLYLRLIFRKRRSRHKGEQDV